MYESGSSLLKIVLSSRFSLHLSPSSLCVPLLTFHSLPPFFLPPLLPSLPPSLPLCFSPPNTKRRAGQKRRRREAKRQRDPEQWRTLAWWLEWMGVEQRYTN